jgi:hypothetical protein
VQTPAISTIHAILDRHGLVKRRTAQSGYRHGSFIRQAAERTLVR